MTGRPDARILLAAARAAVTNEVAPLLDSDAKYQALMAASAIAIAERELVASGETKAIEINGLEVLFGHEAVQAAGKSIPERIAALNWRLCAEIRAGAWDDRQDDVMRFVLSQCRSRLAVTNPKFLERMSGD